MMEDGKQQQQHQKEEEHQHHHQEDKQQQEHQKHLEEEQKQQQQQHQDHQKHPEEEKRQQQQQHQEQQNHQEEENQQEKEQQKEEAAAAENKQNHAVSQFLLSKRSKPPWDYSPVDSPLSSYHSPLSHGFSPLPPTSQSSPPVAVSRAEFASRDQPTATNVEVEEQSHELGSGSGRRLRSDLFILRRTKRDKMVRKALLWFRIAGFVFCLVSFSILAADKDQGWALDSFYHYKEFRFCMAVNVIGFVYSGIQAYDLAYQLTSGKQKPRSHLRCYLDFVLDQILAYILISASSSAAVRVDDWQSNWGKDKFPEMARASMAFSLLAFVALALSSLISGYTLSTFKSM